MVGIKASNSSASSSTSSISSGVTSTVQRTRHIPISIASTKKSTTASSQLRKPSPKQTTVRVQMNEFSVDFGDGDASKLDKNKEESPKASTETNIKAKSSPSTDRKSSSTEKKQVSGLRRPSTASNGSTSSEKKPPTFDKQTISSEKKSALSERRASNASNTSNTSDKKPTTSGIVKIPSVDKTPPSSSKNNAQPIEKTPPRESPQRIVIAEIHRSADEDQPAAVRERSNEAADKSHEEEYRNSQTSDSVVTDEEKHLPASKEGQENGASESTTDQVPQIIDSDVEQVILDQQNEISVDVNERREEDGHITTKILLDSENRAVAARDLEIEIRREIHTEVSPPVSPEPPRSDDNELDRAEKEVGEVENEENPVQETEEKKEAELPREEVNPVRSLKISIQPQPDSKNDIQEGINDIPEDIQNDVQPDSNLPTKSQSEPKQSTNEDPIKPFVFKESKSATPQRYRDVAIRVDSIEKEPLLKEEQIQEDNVTQVQPSTYDAKEVEVPEKKEEIQPVPKEEVQQVPKEEVQQVPKEEVQQVPEKKEGVQQVPEKEEEIQSIPKKSSTPLEIVELDVDERKKSDSDLAEVRVYRERYSEAPILPYPQIIATNSTPDKQVDKEVVATPRIDLANLKPKTEAEKNRRPLVTPVDKAATRTSPNQPAPIKVDTKDAALRPRIISQDQNGHDVTKELDPEAEKLKREPIRLNIASSLHSPPATSPPSPSQYENKKIEKQNGTQQAYPSDLDINGLYKPHPLYPDKTPQKTESKPAQSTTKITTTTTLVSTTQNEELETAAAAERLVASPTLSGRLSAGTGERSENDFTPRTLSRIKHLNVIMECGSEKDAGEVIHHHPIFMRDTSKYWYKPTISREEAIAMLKDKETGTFVVRDSNSFPGAFGLALKVSQAPAGVQPADGTELVRHFLIEPSAKGVKLKGCSNEPVFGTLAALIYQHSITPLALPAKLLLPDEDPATTPEHLNANQALLERGAACNVTYVCSLDTESLTGPEAVRRAVSQGLQLLQQRALRAVPVHFKVSSQGITLTDNTRTLFFRRHYPVTTVTFAGIDPESRLFDNNNAQQLPPTYIRQAPMFGFVARKSPSSPDNACHIFAELDPEQPASAVVRFITNVMLVYAKAQQQQIHRAVAGV